MGRKSKVDLDYIIVSAPGLKMKKNINKMTFSST